jgi:hypothetical protein
MATARTDTTHPPLTLGPDEATPAGVALRAIRTYVSRRFPVLPQVVPLLVGYLCCYLLYGQAFGAQVLGWPTVVGGVSGVLLALVRRIADDLEDLDRDIRSGRLSFADGGRRYQRGLVLGGVTATAGVAVLNATCSPRLLLISVGLAVWIPVATVVRNRTLKHSRALFYLINESCPALGLLYPYFVWHEVTGATLPPMAVLAVGGLFWVSYEFWNFTRKAGEAEGWPPWRMTLERAREWVLAYLGLAAAFGVLVAHYFDLGTGYLVYAVALPLAFATVVLCRWPSARDTGRRRPAWAGLPLGIAVQAGLLVALLVS